MNTGRMTIMIAVAALAGIVLASLAPADGHQRKGQPAGKGAVSYKTQVAPIIKRHCLPCHTEDQLNPSELYLDSYEGIMKGGKHGPPVIPGRPDSSLMIRKLGVTPPFGDPMPLKRKTPLGADTLEVLRRWIAQGAKNN